MKIGFISQFSRKTVPMPYDTAVKLENVIGFFFSTLIVGTIMFLTKNKKKCIPLYTPALLYKSGV